MLAIRNTEEKKTAAKSVQLRPLMEKYSVSGLPLAKNQYVFSR